MDSDVRGYFEAAVQMNQLLNDNCEGEPKYADYNPQAPVCNGYLSNMPLLHQLRELPHENGLSLNELGFFDVDEVEALMSPEDLKQLDDLAASMIDPSPSVRDYPTAPSLKLLLAGNSGKKVVNFGSGNDDFHLKGTYGYDPYHFHTNVSNYGGNGTAIDTSEWERVKQLDTVPVVSRNAIMHDYEFEAAGVQAHIVPNYEKWVEAGLCVRESENMYRTNSIMYAGGGSGSVERCYKGVADCVVGMGMFLVLYFWPAVVVNTKKLVELIDVKTGVLASLCVPGTGATSINDNEFNPKLDGELRHLVMQDGVMTVFDRNRNKIESYDCGAVTHHVHLICEQVNGVYYVLGGFVEGIRIPQLRRVISSFLEKFRFVGDCPVKPRPGFADMGDVPVDGVVGSNFSGVQSHYYKSVSTVDMDIKGQDIYNPEGALHRTARKLGCEIDHDKSLNVRIDYKKLYRVRMCQQCVVTTSSVALTKFFTIVKIEARDDKEIPDNDVKIKQLLMQPKAEQLIPFSVWEGKLPNVMSLNAIEI